MKPLILRQSAEHDYETNFLHCLTQANTKVAADFVHAVDAALDHITLYPGTGPSRYAQSLAVPSLRSWLITKFPFVIMYMDQNDKIDVIRILHQHSDIPQQLQESGLNS